MLVCWSHDVYRTTSASLTQYKTVLVEESCLNWNLYVGAFTLLNVTQRSSIHGLATEEIFKRCTFACMLQLFFTQLTMYSNSTALCYDLQVPASTLYLNTCMVCQYDWCIDVRAVPSTFQHDLLECNAWMRVDHHNAPMSTSIWRCMMRWTLIFLCGLSKKYDLYSSYLEKHRSAFDECLAP